jgi:hypothetical protein
MPDPGAMEGRQGPMAFMTDAEHRPGWLAKLAHLMMGEPRHSAPDGYSVPGNDWPAVPLHMTAEEVDQALMAIDDRTVARARKLVEEPRPSASGDL